MSILLTLYILLEHFLPDYLIFNYNCYLIYWKISEHNYILINGLHKKLIISKQNVHFFYHNT